MKIETRVSTIFANSDITYSSVDYKKKKCLKSRLK